MNRQVENIKKISELLENDAEVLAAIIIGSQARSDSIADEYSDIDIIIIVTNPEQYLLSYDWLRGIGDFHISFIEPTLFGAKERRILFDDGSDVDFVILNEKQSQTIQNNESGVIFARDYRIIKDKIGISESIEKSKYTSDATNSANLSEEELQNLINDYFFHCVWTMKKVSRGELFTAKSCLDVYMKRLLLTMIENYSCLSSSKDVWYNGRFIEKWADKWILDGLTVAYAKYNQSDMINALLSSMDLFRKIAIEVMQKQTFTYPKGAETHAYQIVNKYIQRTRDGEYK